MRTYIELSTRVESSLEGLFGYMAAVGLNPDLLEPIRAKQEEWNRRMENDGMDPALVTLLRLAADGLLYSDLFQIGGWNSRFVRTCGY